MIALSEASRSIAGVLLLAIVAVELGGYLVLRIARGHKATTEMQRTFFRAGHAHAGVHAGVVATQRIFAISA